MRLGTAQAKAERIIAEELNRLHWQDSELAARRRHDPGKVQIAQRLRKETTLSVKQIAERLHFGTAKSASFRLLTTMKTENAANPAQTHLGF